MSGASFFFVFGLLAGPALGAPDVVETKNNALDNVSQNEMDSHVKAAHSKLHETVIRAAEREEQERTLTRAARAKTAWKNAHYNYDGSMEAAERVGKEDWSWNTPTTAVGMPTNGKEDSKEDASTSADVGAYQSKLHESVVRAKEAQTVAKQTVSTKWKHPKGGKDDAAYAKSEDWAWGGGASALQASAALRGSSHH
mmetsp:Transcript_6993/g.12956  ORF Transcript_6993/g.12956 Transcript_6993/m.12956 type:complete len:197 (-) Transcript_6993:167-757(-)